MLAFVVLLIFQCLGEGLVFLFGFPVPGPVTGMLLLLAALLAFPRLHEIVEQGANELLRHLSLLFVPAGAGIITTATTGRGSWLAIAAGVVVSTVATLAVTALVLQATMPRRGAGDDQAREDSGHV